MDRITEKEVRDALAAAGFIPSDGKVSVKIVTPPARKKDRDIGIDNKPIPVFSGLKGDGTTLKTCEVSLNSSTKQDFIANLNDGDPISFYINTKDVDYISIKPENMPAVIDWLKQLYDDISKHTSYFEPPVEMSLKDIEKALGYRIKVV